jgi:CPA2 family monovalent cation:H+ antiporter-2
MHSPDLVFLLAAALGGALLLGLVAQRLRLPPIVGYLAAGVIVGPHTPGFVANPGLASELAELGVVLLLFGVGLEFHVEQLLAVKSVAIPAAVGQLVLVTLASAVSGHALGLPWIAAVIFGIAVSITSTVVLMRALGERGELHTPSGHLAVGWLVVEDLLTVLVLVLVPALVNGGRTSLVSSTLAALAKIGALVAFTFIAGGRVIPRLLERVVATRSRELFTLAVLVVALGVSLGAAELFGASMALGAFLAGVVVGRSDFASRAASEALPMRDAFAVLFFVSVGMLVEPSFVWREPLLVAVTLALITLLKPAISALLLVLLGRPARSALAIAAGRGQIGEFSFILAALGAHLGVLPARAASALTAASILSITLNPLLLRFAPHADALLPERTPAEAKAQHRRSRRARVVLVGFGPIGRTLARLLEANGIEPSIIELNLDTVRELRASGGRAVYGDATRAETLEEAGLRDAVGLILTAPVEGGADGVVRRARELNASLFVIARSHYIAEAPLLREAGADVVFSGEGEVALAITEFTLARLGAAPSRIEHERERVHQELARLGEGTRSGARRGPDKNGGTPRA